MKKVFITFVMFLICSNLNAQLLLLHEKIRKIREQNRLRRELLEIRFLNDSVSATKGDAEAQYKYGLYCFFVKDKEKGISLLQKSAKQKNPNACGVIGEILFQGAGLPQNRDEAFKYFKKAASLNDTLSICYLGICSYYGYGVSKNYNEAVKYFSIASASSFESIRTLALFYLAKCYRYGRGIKRDPSISNIILLDYNVYPSIGQEVLSNILYDDSKTLSLINPENLYQNTAEYISSVNIRELAAKNISIVREKYEKSENMVSPDPSVWLEAVKKQSEEEHQYQNPLESEKFDDKQIDIALADARARLEGIKSACKEGVPSDGYYYHLVSIDGNDIEICDENRFLISKTGLEYILSNEDNSTTILTFNKEEKLSRIEPGQYAIRLSNNKQCNIYIYSDTDFTYTINITINGKQNTYRISKVISENYYAPTFGLG